MNSNFNQKGNFSVRVPKKVNNKLFYFLFFMGISVFSWIIIKDINIPSWLTVSVSIVTAFSLLLLGINKPEIPFYVLVAYVPFNKIFSGTFGGFMTALNLTNILIFITFFCLLVNRGMEPKSIVQEGRGTKDDGSTTPFDKLRTSLTTSGRKRITKVRSGFHWLVLIFCLLGIFSVFRGGFYYGSRYVMEFIVPLKRWLTPIFLYFLTLGIVKDKEIFKKTTIIIMIVVTVAGLLALKEYVDIGDSSNLDRSRVGGLAEQPNMMGAFFVYYMFLFLGFFLLNWRKVQSWALLIPFLICFRGIQVTFSRGALLAFAFGLVAITFLKNKALFILLCFVTILALLNPQMLPGGLRYAVSRTEKGGEVFEGVSLESRVDVSSAKRLEIWKGASEIIKDNPFFGVGYGVFPYVIPYYTSGIGEMDAHNTYLILAAEMGIPVLLLFLLIMFILIKNVFWLYMRTKDLFVKSVMLGMLGGLFGALVVNMFGSRMNSEEVSSYFWVLAGLTVSAVIMYKKKQIE